MKYLKGKRMRLGLCLGLIATFIIGMASWAQTTMVADAPTAGDTAASVAAAADTDADTDASGQPAGEHLSLREGARKVVSTTGLAAFMSGQWRAAVMLVVGLVLLYLGVARDFEPLLLVPIGFGCLLVNAPFAGMGEDNGLLGLIYNAGIENDLLPLLIFMGIGAMSDFSPLLGSPRVVLLGAAAQFGVFGTLLGVILLNQLPGFDFTLKEASAIAIIGAADGPTSIVVGRRFAPNMMGSIAVAAYSYMALVPLIQPPIMRLLTTRQERLIRMRQERPVSRLELILFPLLILLVCIVFLPAAVPLMGSLALGNFIRECGAVNRLSNAMQNEIMNIATIMLGLGVGMQLEASQFLQPATLGIILIGLLAFSLGTAGGVIFAKIMNLFSPNNPINPLIGSAGVSAFPMAARVSTRVAMEYDPQNVLLMHAMGANVAGQIGSIVAGGVILALFS
ncbi:MAG: sodium ion-translocating decarboxylase subunit beta [Kiritimatiellia bacterium]|jgi:sodium ion-translocating decarboxylase beta subunit